MYDMQTLTEIFQENKISIYQICKIGDALKKGFAFMTLDEFIEFLLNQKITCVFVYQQYEFLDEYLITNEVIEENSRYTNNDFIETIMPEIQEYNNSIKSIDFETPSFIVLMCLYGSSHFYTILSNGITDDLIEPKYMFKEICNRNEDKLKEINIKHKEKIEELKEKLREKVLSDNNFWLCTNKDLRMNYAKKLFNEVLDEHFLPLKEYWIRNDLGMLYQEAYNFFDMLWNELKQKK